MGIPTPPPPPPPEATSFIITLEVDGVDNTTIKPDAPFAGADVNLMALSIIVKSVAGSCITPATDTRRVKGLLERNLVLPELN